MAPESWQVFPPSLTAIPSVCDTVWEAEACRVTFPHTVIPSWELTSTVTQGLTHFECQPEPIHQNGIPMMQVICIGPTSWDLHHLSTTTPPLQQASWDQQPHPACGRQTALTPHYLKRRGRWGLHLEECATPQIKSFGCVSKIMSKDIPSRHLCASVHS